MSGSLAHNVPSLHDASLTRWIVSAGGVYRVLAAVTAYENNLLFICLLRLLYVTLSCTITMAHTLRYIIRDTVVLNLLCARCYFFKIKK